MIKLLHCFLPAGLEMSRYSPALATLMERLVVAPMLTKYLFWKKVQSVGQLKQRWAAGQMPAHVHVIRYTCKWNSMHLCVPLQYCLTTGLAGSVSL